VRAELFQADRRANERTDRYDEANSRFSQFCERAEKLRTLFDGEDNIAVAVQ